MQPTAVHLARVALAAAALDISAVLVESAERERQEA
jgi:hypothetical protein